MARRPHIEEFPRYQNYLGQGDVWPSESTGEFIKISEMPPRYAASALQKLLRWGGTHLAYVSMNMSNADERIHHLRNSPLGKALAAQAQGLDHDNVLEQLDEEFEGVTPLEMATAFAEIVHDCFPDTGLDRILACASKLSLAVANRWTVTHTKR